MKMLEYDKIDILEGIDINKTNLLREFVTLDFLKILVLSHIFAMVVTT